ncbi:MAG: hypothetical protein V1676_05495 [Candidatus Diapherotrites archaeon]
MSARIITEGASAREYLNTAAALFFWGFGMVVRSGGSFTSRKVRTRFEPPEVLKVKKGGLGGYSHISDEYKITKEGFRKHAQEFLEKIRNYKDYKTNAIGLPVCDTDLHGIWMDFFSKVMNSASLNVLDTKLIYLNLLRYKIVTKEELVKLHKSYILAKFTSPESELKREAGLEFQLREELKKPHYLRNTETILKTHPKMVALNDPAADLKRILDYHPITWMSPKIKKETSRRR